MLPQIKLLHNRQAVGEAIAWTFQFANFFDASCLRDETEIPESSPGPLIILTDEFHFSRMSEMASMPPYPIILIVDDIESNFVLDALLAGVTGVANISKGPEVLIEKVQEVLQGKNDDQNILIQKLLRQKTGKEIKEETDYDLTKKEKQILIQLRDGVHLKLIAQNTGITYETVRTHIKRIYKKLGVMSVSEAVIKAMKINLQ